MKGDDTITHTTTGLSVVSRILNRIHNLRVRESVASVTYIGKKTINLEFRFNMRKLCQKVTLHSFLHTQVLTQYWPIRGSYSAINHFKERL